MKVYTESGYVNIEGILGSGYPFNFIIGGRGTGKTYTSLLTAYQQGIMFMLMRRTQSQADLISRPEFSVFKPINADQGTEIFVERISKYNSRFYEGEKTVGFTCALSTLSNMRGFDASDIKLLIYDEFIPEKHERLLKSEGDALFNAYETMNRNRELRGDPPMQLLCLANSNDVVNPVFESLNLIRIADRMQRTHQEVFQDDKRGIQLVILTRSPISRKKGSTALYSLTEGTDFAAMAIDNDFRIDRSNIRSRPLTEYVPVCTLGECCIYKHKSESRLYATTHRSGHFSREFKPTDKDRALYRRIYAVHWKMYIGNKIDFEDVLAESIFVNYWNT